jgi:hypothetical protein
VRPKCRLNSRLHHVRNEYLVHQLRPARREAVLDWHGPKPVINSLLLAEWQGHVRAEQQIAHHVRAFEVDSRLWVEDHGRFAKQRLLLEPKKHLSEKRLEKG